MRRFWVVLSIVTALFHAPFVVGLHEVLRRAGVAQPWGVTIAATALLLIAFQGRVRLVAMDRPVSTARRVLVEEPYFVHWCALIAATPAWLVATVVASLLYPFVPRAALPSVGALAAGAYVLGFLVALWGVMFRRRWVRVRTLDIPVPGLGDAFDGYRIAHLSDLHIGSHTPRDRAEGWARMVNDLGVDLVALTGDYVTSGVAFHRDIAEVLGSLKARDGAVAVMGNHDYFGDGEPLVRAMRQCGVTVLRNERTEVVRGEERLEIAGVDDTWTRRADIRRTLAGRDERLPLLVLAHDPQLFPALAKHGAELVLSDHTHWGQIAVPFFEERYNLSSRTYRYHADLYRDGDATLYVHPGLGTTGPPVRLGVAPEITVLRLRAAPRSNGQST
jgi:hypothetical protein